MFVVHQLWELPNVPAPCGGFSREQDPKSPPFTTAGFARMVERAGVEAKLPFKAHPHMLRHACGSRTRGTTRDLCKQEYPTHCALHGHGARAVQEFLALIGAPLIASGEHARSIKPIAVARWLRNVVAS